MVLNFICQISIGEYYKNRGLNTFASVYFNNYAVRIVLNKSNIFYLKIRRFCEAVAISALVAGSPQAQAAQFDLQKAKEQCRAETIERYGQVKYEQYMADPTKAAKVENIVLNCAETKKATVEKQEAEEE